MACNDKTTMDGNHLDRVICQIMFNPILSIDNEIGVIQNRLKDMYPHVSISSEPALPIISAPSINNYCFETEDHKWKVNVTRSFISLTAVEYDCWCNFRERICHLIDVVEDVFNIGTFTRIGLRYINTFRLSKLQRTDSETWSTFFQESTLGMFNVESADITNYSAVVEYAFEGYKLRSITGQIKFHDNGEIGFLVDNDLYCEEPHNHKEASSLLDLYNEENCNILRKMVKEITIERMR